MKSGMTRWQPDRCLPVRGARARLCRRLRRRRGLDRGRLPTAECAARAGSTCTASAILLPAPMAERFAAEGYAFYALDLRKHGRSMRLTSTAFLQERETSCSPTSSRARGIRRRKSCCRPFAGRTHPIALRARGRETRPDQGLWLTARLRLEPARVAQGARCTSPRRSGATPFLNDPRASGRLHEGAAHGMGSSTPRSSPTTAFRVLRLLGGDQRAFERCTRGSPSNVRCSPCIRMRGHRARLASHRAGGRACSAERRGPRLSGRVARPRLLSAASARKSSSSFSPGRKRAVALPCVASAQAR